MSTTPPLSELVALAARLPAAAPRYTSYPSAPFWRSEPHDAAYRTALAGLTARPADPVALYVHLPFCLTRCAYCISAMSRSKSSALRRWADAAG
jgi:oxygen-independent coproporphyrinogen III oxidase